MIPQELIEAVENAERVARIARGLPPSHVLDLREFPFCFAMEAVSEFRRVAFGYPEKHFLHVWAHLAAKDIDGANYSMEQHQAAEPLDPRAAMRFGSYPPGEMRNLPSVEGDYPTDCAYFLCCDGVYFRNFGIVLLRSLAEHSPGLRVHMHLMNPDMNLMRFVEALKLHVSLSHETCPQDKNYYHAIRLVRFSEALERCESLLMTDTDALVADDVRDLISGPPALRVRPGRLAPWNQFSACFVRGDASSREYFKRVSAIIRSSPLWWGMDQYALFSAWTALKPSITLVGPEIASVDDSPGPFWFTAGAAKKSLLTDRSNYAQRFQHYIRK